MTPEQQFVRFREQADAAALAAVFDALAPELLLVAAHLVGRDAEDLVQATFLDAIEKAARWDSSRRLLPWLIGILVNHGRSERRRTRRRVDLERLAARAEPSPFDALAADELAEQLADGLRALPRQLRQTMTLRLVHGLSPTEIAHAMGCPVATAKTRLQRGMEWLRRVLPAGVGAAACMVATSTPALAAVRATVLARAEAAVPLSTAGVTAGVVIGGLLMKKVVLAVAALLGFGAWLLFDLTPASAPVVAPAAAAPAVAGVAAVAGETPPSVASASPQRTTVAADAPQDGAAALEFVWKGDLGPARGLTVGIQGPIATQRMADDEGRLELRGLPAGDYRLFGTKLSHRLRIQAGQETRECIEVQPSLQIEGIVFDAEWRRIDGAVVFCQSFPRPDEVSPRGVAVAGADGTFRAALDWGGSFWAQKPGYAPSPCSTTLDEGTSQLVLVLGEARGSVRGTVRAANGFALADAEVAIVRLEPADACAAPIVLRTDERGLYATTELGLGKHLVVAQASGHAATPVPLDVDGSEQVCDLTLALGAGLQGKVVDSSGAPLAAVVTVRPRWAGAQPVWVEALRPLFHRCRQCTHTDGSGEYHLEHVPAGQVTVEVDARRVAAPEARELQLPAGGELRADFALGRTRQLTGRLLDERNQPIAGWHVQAWPVGGGVLATVTSGERGDFRLEGLDADEFVVEARPAARLDSVPWARAANVRPADGEFVLHARTREEDGARLSGTLLGADGAPPRHTASGWLIPAGEREGRHFVLALDDAGAFRLGPLPAGRYQVGVRVQDEAAVQLGTHDLAPRQQLDLGITRLPAHGELTVRLTTPAGVEVEPAEALVHDRAGNGGMLLRGRDGVLRGRDLPAGIYTLSAWGADFVLADTPVVVAAERTTASEIQVEPAPSVRFELLRPAVEQGERWRAAVELRLRDAADRQTAAQRWSLDITDRHTWRRGLRPGAYHYEVVVRPSANTVRGDFVVPSGSGELVVEIQLPIASPPK
jgi:RNA polymerase sigma-70 factor (ECF subfamily)